MPFESNSNNFWTRSANRDPKRSYRFRVQFGGATDYLWYAKKATKPAVSITESSHQYLNHTYYWPGRTEWNEVDITFIDPVDPDLSGQLVQTLVEAGYRIPANAATDADWATPSKKGFIDGTGAIIIEQIDEEGNVLEQWKLNNAWIKEITFGDLDYESEGLTEVMVKFRYDWASFSSRGDSIIQDVFTRP